MDIYHITPKLYAEYIDKSCCEIYFLGYPNISIEEKFKQIREFDTIYDWTNEKDDFIVKKHIRDYIEISKWFKGECRKYDLPFIDVSENREQVLKELAKIICSG